MKLKIFISALLTLVVACTPSVQDSDQARQTLLDFFDQLNRGQYEQAADIYGGVYDILSENNPEIAPDNHAALWEAGCQINGFQCLPLRSATLKEQAGNTFIFTVEFSNADGSLFLQGPCCGADATENPPVSKFDFRVVEISAGKFQVLDLPVYIP